MSEPEGICAKIGCYPACCEAKLKDIMGQKDAEIARLKEQLRLANIDACNLQAEVSEQAEIINKYRAYQPVPTELTAEEARACIEAIEFDLGFEVNQKYPGLVAKLKRIAEAK